MRGCEFGDTVTMNSTDEKNISVMTGEEEEQQLLAQTNNPTATLSLQEGRFTMIHRRGRVRGEVEKENSSPNGHSDDSAIGDVLTSARNFHRIRNLIRTLFGKLPYFLFQVKILDSYPDFSRHSLHHFIIGILNILQLSTAGVAGIISLMFNQRLWAIIWIALTAAAEIFVYLVLAMAAIFVAIIVNISEDTKQADIVKSKAYILKASAIPKSTNNSY